MRIISILTLSLTIALAACVQVAPAPTPPGGNLPPTIVVFDTRPHTIPGGGTTTLSWEVTGATAASIDQGVGNVVLKGSRALMPSESTTYTLTATGAGGTTTARAQVNVVGSSPLSFNLPLVPVFYVEPALIAMGWPSRLRWEVANASQVTIEPNIGTVPVVGSMDLSPQFTTNYRLTATNTQGSIVATTTLTVSGIPPNRDMAGVTRFKADPYVIRKGESAILSWATRNTSSVVIDQDIGTVAAEGQRQVSPAETTIYTLIATSTDGAQYQTATVNVIR